MQAILLVGGFGTRLQSVVPNIPKPMAPINDKPFLDYLIRYLKSQGITRIILAVHYQASQIKNYFANEFAGIAIDYVDESEPLGTGGAIVNALAAVKNDEPVFVLNGDSFVKLNYSQMYQQHLEDNVRFTMALRHVPDCARYGNVIVKDNLIIKFAEKGNVGPGYINAGVYLINKNAFEGFNLAKVFSIETEFLFPNIEKIQPHAYLTDDYFIDIGVPEDYQRACSELPHL